MTRVLAFDPGESTGWALFSYADRAPAELIDQGVIPDGVDGFIKWARSMPGHDLLVYAETIVYEDFVIDGTITGSWSSETIGALKALYAVANKQDEGHKLVKQTRQDKASLFGHKAKTTELRQTERFNWLRDRGFIGVSHELDAITHALFYIKRQGHVPTIKRYWTEWEWLDDTKTTSIRTL